MFSSIWNFVKRHRRKFIFTGVVIGGGYVLAKYAKQKFLEYQDKEAEECLAFARKQHHFDSNQRTCNMTVLSMMSTLRESLLHNLNTEVLTSQLKDRPANKLEIWETLKIMSVTRTVVAVYTSCLLIVVLRVQLNVIGGYIFLDNQSSHNALNHQAYASSNIQQKYLLLIQHIVRDGLTELINVTRSAVCEVLGDVSLKQQVSLFDVQDILNKVRQRVEFRRDNGYYDAAPSSLCQFIMPEENEPLEACSLSHEEIIMNRLKRETQDIIESSDFHSVLTTCLDTAFTRLVDKIAEFFKPPKSSGEESPIINPNDIRMPLAKLIPVMNGLVYTVCGDAPNQFVQELLLKDQVKDFAANIYEAFSQPDTQMLPG